LTETIINLESVNPIDFFGVNNNKFDLLKKKFPLLKILSRGTQIKLSGAPEQIDIAKEKIELVIQYMERNGHLSENYFEQILGGDDAEVIDNFIDQNPNEILVLGPNGKTVRARTANQKKMVTSADKNDIVFAIGPAGTGKTYTAVALAVRALKNKLVKKIILKELIRKGQVYYICNKIYNLEKKINILQKNIPEAKFKIAHGQMKGNTLKKIIYDFYQKKFDVLICTTIIETGIDIPTVNTIIIEDAHSFGLAQLHQMRGRVGRSHIQAYAWLLVPDVEKISLNLFAK